MWSGPKPATDTPGRERPPRPPLSRPLAEPQQFLGPFARRPVTDRWLGVFRKMFDHFGAGRLKFGEVPSTAMGDFPEGYTVARTGAACRALPLREPLVRSAAGVSQGENLLGLKGVIPCRGGGATRES